MSDSLFWFVQDCACSRDRGHVCRPSWVHPADWDQPTEPLENGVLSQVRTAPSTEAPGAAAPRCDLEDTVDSTRTEPARHSIDERDYPLLDRGLR